MTSPNGSSFAVVRKVLGSGVRFLCAPLPATHRAAITVHISSGPRFEAEPLSGISHFHEHMLHRGTQRHPSAHALALAFEELGSELGAATYIDHTLLSASVPIENLNSVLELFGELVTAPAFTNLEIERGIVREEILESLNDAGVSVDPDELIMSLAFPGHPLGRPITGTLDTLASFDVEALRRFHAENYHAQGMVLSVSGPVDVDSVLATAERAFAAVPSGQPRALVAPPEPAGPIFRYLDEAGSQTALRVAFRAPSEADPREAAAELLLRVLDDGMSTRLYHEVCDERGLAYDVSATYEAFADTGLFTLAGDSAHRSAEQLLGAFFGVLRDLMEHGPTDAELAKAKRRLDWQMRSLLDDPGELAAYLGLGELTGLARTPRERTESLRAVTSKDVRSAAQHVFDPRGLAVAAIGQLSKPRRKALEQLVAEFGAHAARP